MTIKLSTILLILTVIFTTLKLTGNIGWSWWWVFSPLWIGVALIVVILLIAALVLWLGAK